MTKIASEPPAPWQIPDIIGLLLMPIAILFLVVDALAFHGTTYKDDRQR